MHLLRQKKYMDLYFKVEFNIKAKYFICRLELSRNDHDISRKLDWLDFCIVLQKCKKPNITE